MQCLALALSVCVQGILINVQKVSAKWNRNELLSSGCPLPLPLLLLCFSVHSFIITPLTAAPWTMLRQRHRRVWRRSDGADQQQQQQQSSRTSLTHTHGRQALGARSICRSFVVALLYSSFMLARFALSILKSSSNNQPNVSMFRTCLVSLATTTCCCCCNVVMEVKRRAKMKTSLQFNVRTWHSAAGRWPFRYSNLWLSFLHNSLARELSQIASLFLPLLRESVTILFNKNHTAFAYLHGGTNIHTYLHTYTFFF